MRLLMSATGQSRVCAQNSWGCCILDITSLIQSKVQNALQHWVSS